MDKIKEILGLRIHAIIHYYAENKISISFDNTNKRVEFYDCPLVFDSGVIGKTVHIAEGYYGEMSFVILFREMGLDIEDYSYFIIKGEEGIMHSQNQMRIAYKKVKLIE